MRTGSVVLNAAVLGAAGATMLVALASPALAEWGHRGGHHQYRHGGYGYYRPPVAYYAPRPVYPPYYPPPRVYYAPPPPTYYAPPGLGFSFTIR
jgi:hypothetical protein